MAGRPGVELRDHFVADFCQKRRGGRFDIQILNESRIVGYDIEEILRALECADDGFIGASKDADDLAFAASLGSGKKSRFLRLARDARHDAVAVHGGETILGPYVEVRLALLFIEHMRPAIGVHLEDTCKEIGFFGDDVAVAADAGDVAGGFHFFQQLEEFAFPGRREVQRRSDSSGVQWALGDLTKDRGAEFLRGLAGVFLKCAAAFWWLRGRRLCGGLARRFAGFGFFALRAAFQRFILSAVFGIRHSPSIAPPHGAGKPRLFPMDSGGLHSENACL